MSTRARHEHQILLFGKVGSHTFEDALTYLAFKHGLDWFTDDQIADMRERLIGTSWFSYKINRENRKRLASKERAA